MLACMEALLHITVGSCALACRQLPHLELVCSADASNLPVHLMLVSPYDGTRTAAGLAITAL